MPCKIGYKLAELKHMHKTQKDKAKGTKKQIGLFFGSFNPIHLGHTQLAEYIYNHSKFDELWYVVSPRNPLKEQAELIDEHHRKKMIELATVDKPYIQVSAIEFDMPKPSYTIDTLEKLAATYPSYSFTLIVGSDNVIIFDQWKDYQHILDEFSVLVYPREGYDSAPFLKNYPQLKIIENAPHFPISSTEIRQAIQKKLTVIEWLHPSIRKYIKKNNLYLDGGSL